MRKRHTSKGFFSTITRKSGAVVVYRWYKPGSNGTPREHKRVLGPAKELRSEAAAWREVERLGLGRRSENGPRNIKELVDHWLEKECSMEDGTESRRAFSTKDTYRGYLRKWIVPRWGDYALEEVKAIAVEEWLATLKKDNGEPLAPGSKKKIRDLLHVLFEHAIRYEWAYRNPLFVGPPGWTAAVHTRAVRCRSALAADLSGVGTAGTNYGAAQLRGRVTQGKVKRGEMGRHRL